MPYSREEERPCQTVDVTTPTPHIPQSTDEQPHGRHLSEVLAFTFPGQGSQRPGMGEPWTDQPAWEIVRDASEMTGINIAHLLLHADAEELTRTDNAQLATYVLSMVVSRSLERVGITPSIVAGHSLGEYSALTAAGVIDVPTGCKLVSVRGKAMVEAAQRRNGTMYAIIGLSESEVRSACDDDTGDVWIANLNSDGQIVISGDPEALERVAKSAKERGAKRTVGLPVGGAFHSPFMESATQALGEALATVSLNHTPTVPVVTNVDAALHADHTDWPSLLSDQLTSPVRWIGCTEQLVRSGATLFVECGPGSVLTGLAKRNAPSVRTVAVSSPDDMRRLVELVTTSTSGGTS